jgi:hypothetical protein
VQYHGPLAAGCHSPPTPPTLIYPGLLAARQNMQNKITALCWTSMRIEVPRRAMRYRCDPQHLSYVRVFARARCTCKSTRQFWASETLQKRLSNASVTVQKRSTSRLHLLLDVLIYHGRFHGQWGRCCGAVLNRFSTCQGKVR